MDRKLLAMVAVFSLVFLGTLEYNGLWQQFMTPLWALFAVSAGVGLILWLRVWEP